MNRRERLRVEEAVNTITHGLGAAASAVALPLFIYLGARNGDLLLAAGMGVFGITLLGAYAASVMYHSARSAETRAMWLRVDYAAIYLLIAGTYTPIALGALRGTLGMALLVVVWTGALIGVYEKLRGPQRHPLVSALPYLGLGWLAIVAIDPILAALGWAGFKWLLAGGVAYSVGVIFYACDNRMKFGHCVWHLFVLGGSACHVVAVTLYGIRLPQ